MLIHASAFAPELWSDWSLEPGIALPILITALVYARGVRILEHRASRARPRLHRSALLFSLGLASLVLALLSPLDEVADALFSAHMVQHLILILVAAPLCVAAAPIVPLLWGLPAPVRRAVGALWRRPGAVRRGWGTLTSPGIVFTLHTGAIWFWHFPGPYQAALQNEGIHALEHLSFFGTALLFWWLVIQPIGHRRLAYGAALLFVGGTLVQGGALGALLMFSPVPWYPAHAAGAHAWGMSLMDDQQLAGLIMWIPAGFAYVGTACALFVAWMRDEEAKTAHAPAKDWPVTPRRA